MEPIEDWESLSEEVNGQHSYLIEYYKKCRSGEIIIGRELKTELEMLIQEIFLHADKYRFELEAPQKRIKFIEKYVKHFEAPYAGDSFILTLPQKAITEAVFGFKVYDTELLGGGKWVRQFKETTLLMARKNGKTPFIAALTLAEWFCGESGQKVMCASNDYEEASLVWDCIKNFCDESKELAKVTRSNVHGIFFGNPRQKKTTGKFSSQNKGSIKKMSARASSKEGRNLKIVIVDEVHEMKDRNTIMPLRSSLTTQEEPLFFEITTEGMVRDGYLDERLTLARKVLRGEEERDRWLIWLYTQDSENEIWEDEDSWVKSNPLLGVVKKKSDLRELVNEARINGSQRAFTLAKEFNIKELNSTALFREQDIDNDKTFNLEDFSRTWCIVGVDLAETNDLCAVTYLFEKPNDETKYMHTMYFVTSNKAAEFNSNDSPTNFEKKDYQAWSDEGLVKIVNGNVIDDEVIVDYMWSIFQNYSIRPYRIGYDPWHSGEFTKLVEKRFGGEYLTKIKMNPETINTPTRILEADLRAGNINYQNNSICKWCFRNTSVKHNSAGLVMPAKLNGYVANKIDGTMSKIIAIATLQTCKSAFNNIIGD